MNSTESVIRAYYDAFNRGDMPAFLALLTDDVIHDINQGVRETGITQGRLHRLRFLGQGDRRGGSDHTLAVERKRHDRRGRVGVNAQVLLLVNDVTVIEVRPLAEDRHAQRGQIADVSANGVAGDGGEIERHG